MEWGLDRKQDMLDEKNPKRRMKTPSQLEILERVYADDKYPSESVMAELSAQLELTHKQLQMWFGHKRLKDRKVKEEETPSTSRKIKKDISPAPKELSAANVGDTALVDGNYYDEYGHAFGPYERETKALEIRHDREFLSVPKKRKHTLAFKVDPRAAAELAAIAAVEAQLGEPLREDGPVLGVDFDPLPPGAFETSIETVRPKEPMRPRTIVGGADGLHHDIKARQMHDIKPLKAASSDFGTLQKSEFKRKAILQGNSISKPQRGARAPHEYQFIPEQPARAPFYERSLLSNFERPLEMLPQQKGASLASTGSLLNKNELFPTGNGYGFENRLSTNGYSFLPSNDGRTSLFKSNDFNHEPMNKKGSYAAFSLDGQYGAVPVAVTERPLGSEKLALFHEQERAKMEKKRKTEEARLAKEIDAQEKRIRKEIEKQDAIRRKREEQIRKEIEKQDREKKKEENKLNREKLREEERVQRELKRELERREKILQKEHQRAEIQRQKEEIRREKEAARMRAAFERATAKKLAKESKGALDDEELELIQAHAIIAQGLSSTQASDGKKIPLIGPYEAITKRFPPSSVRMKKPFSISPWIDSAENVSKFFMVWRFLTIFADVLGLWPFTVEELAQSLHDYDSRLLNEIHVALLKTLVKDVEGAAQAAVSGAGGSTHATAVAACGHARVVEAAFAWGFDIQEWGQLAHPLTWPEVMRQFALAAGFGPRWKKQKVEAIYPKDLVEVNEGENVIANLRSGAAAANAIALMQGKRVGQMGRTRCRLTPGTVKYAAFHVLSLEGDNGLSVSDVVDRIQKSGLRDLSTSKTPEASISAALSRDTNVFERVAPSRYSVRPAFRKDPQYAEEILQAAREEIRVYETDLLDSEEADKDTEGVEDVDADNDSDFKQIKDTVPDNMENGPSAGKVAYHPKQSKISQSEGEYGKTKHPETSSAALKKKCSFGSSLNLGECMKVIAAEDCKQVQELKDNPDHDEVEIDESQVGEPWVQGLTEGEYANLSVEERLNALASLIDAINEGNTIRVALEERHEAASAYRRQLWEEVQLDKRRVKEELISKSQPTGTAGAKSEGAEVAAGDESEVPVNVAADGICALVHEERDGESPIVTFNSSNKDSKAAQQAETTPGPSAMELEMPDGVSVQEKLASSGESALCERPRAQIKAEIRLRAEKLYVFRSLPLGYDRRRNRYWHFVTGIGAQDPGSGRIYFESQEDGHWEVIDTEESFDVLLSSLDTRGVREFHLHTALKKIDGTFRQGIRSSASVTQPILRSPSSELGHKLEVPAMELVPGQQTKDFLDFRSTSISKTDDIPPSGICPENYVLELPGAIQVELSNNASEKLQALERFRDTERWLWVQCFKSGSSLRAITSGKTREAELLNSCDICHELYWPKEKHCPCCHMTVDSYKREKKFQQHIRECEEQMRREDLGWKFHSPAKVLPPRAQLLKKVILAIEAAIPHEALRSYWTEARKSWCTKFKRAYTPAELLESFLELESAVEQEWLSSSYERPDEILKSSSSGVQKNGCDTSDGPLCLPWVPRTTAAVALHVMGFDSALAYSTEEKQQRENFVMANQDDENELQMSPVTSGAPDAEDDDESYQSVPELDRDAPAERHVRVRGRGRGRCNTAGSEGRLGSSKRKLHSSDAILESKNSGQVTKTARGRVLSHPRGRPARGRGRGGQVSGCKQLAPEVKEKKWKRSSFDSSVKKKIPSDCADETSDNTEQEAFDDWDLQNQSGASEPSENEQEDVRKEEEAPEEEYGHDSDELDDDDAGEDEDEEDDAREIDIEISEQGDSEYENSDDEEVEEDGPEEEEEEDVEVDEADGLQSSS